ncbi:MAG: restriction endonuclease, partial [Flavobacteriaceae bacterium]|nr:restriction endonuclease [Flavobacteriaceae bacterium]
HNDIATLDLERFDVKMKLEIVHEFGNDNREIWNHLSKRDVKRIEDELAPLVKPQNGDTDLARYYDKLLFTLITKRLETPNSEAFINSFMIPITKVVGTSKKLLMKTTIPAVKSKEALIKLPLEEDFWKTEGIVHLEKLRKGVRELVKYIDPEDQRYVTTDFADYIIEDKIKTNKFSDTETPGYTSPFQNNVHRLEQLIRENENHITISRIRKGEAITKLELQALEAMLFKGGIDKEAIEKELGAQFSLETFILALMGLSQEKVDAAFAKFTNDYQLNAVQIQFLDTIKKFLTTNGRIEPSKLYDSPFKNFHGMGIDGVFTEKQADAIFKIVEDFNQAN